MTPRVDRINRVFLILIGIVLVVIGVLALLQSGSVFGSARAKSPVVSDPTAHWYGANGTWFWPTAGAVMLVIAGLCVWWVSAQIRTQGSTRIELDRGHDGTVTASAAALADCVEADTIAQPGIARARAKLSSVGEITRLHLTLWVESPYDIADAVARVTNTVLPHLSYAFDGPTPRPLRTTIHVEAAEAPAARLR
ncbi:hypothetical protein CLV47_102390 [Antricoccus suffuscus]|uniref:Uncharacterized protein n=1 Tax=Antricoccus suffuscus TaxID=1629062 RepID=A0A2T1A531_9ACTN|nr:hypothetical protein [Antricoccus suffuscus]PRZ43699.1 hypothetical protein CLV47_102390 [Antricoccus suffuscus]